MTDEALEARLFPVKGAIANLLWKAIIADPWVIGLRRRRQFYGFLRFGGLRWWFVCRHLNNGRAIDGQTCSAPVGGCLCSACGVAFLGLSLLPERLYDFAIHFFRKTEVLALVV